MPGMCLGIEAVGIMISLLVTLSSEQQRVTDQYGSCRLRSGQQYKSITPSLVSLQTFTFSISFQVALRRRGEWAGNQVCF